ncbi:hypothetical protein NDU88_006664 [Pleurodeles waltl]|uniref:Uncharacterized protein n=1 Tax=Pleurodeles waltl TaxID=8319 RepID=A0AAV7VS16_PLEWA|nr:hypothetical protein NDU88_006664 [Pleurodeles waltl]
MDKSGTDSCAILFGRAAFQEVLSVMALTLRDLPSGCVLESRPPCLGAGACGPRRRPEPALEHATLERAAVRGLRSLTPPPGGKYCGVREPMPTVPTKCQHWCLCVVRAPSLDPDPAGVPAFAVDAGV